MTQTITTKVQHWKMHHSKTHTATSTTVIIIVDINHNDADNNCNILNNTTNIYYITIA